MTTPSEAIAVAAALDGAVNRVVRGKSGVVRLSLTALLSGGHLLLQDLPGTGKTLLGHTLAVAMGGRFGRVQCTPDLLPADITGTSVYQPNSGDWHFRPGPIMANVVLVDEVNRASPRTQSALLEPMEEHQVTIDGTTHALPRPFLCIATQNPHGQAGTFPLPESQLDRFALTVSMGYPDRTAEREVLAGIGARHALETLVPVTTPELLHAVIEAIGELHVETTLLDYLLDLIDATRAPSAPGTGASTRVAVSTLALARAHAVLCGRTYVTPDDVQSVFVCATAHRVGAPDGSAQTWHDLNARMAAVPVPR